MISVRLRAEPTSLSALIGRWMRLTPLVLATVAVSLTALIFMNGVYSEREHDAVEATRLARVAHESMLVQQTAANSYMFTGDERYLHRYEAAHADLELIVPELERTLPAVDATGYVAMRVAQEAWFEQWVPDALFAGDVGAVRGAGVEALLAEGRTSFDRYRDAQSSLMDTMVQHRSAAIAGQAEAVGRTAALALGLALACAFVVSWRGRRLRRAIEPALDGILDDLARIRDHDLEPRPSRGGPEELVRIEAGVADTADALRGMLGRVQEQTERVTRQNRDLGAVLRLSREVAGSLNLGYVLRGVCDATAAIAEARAVVWLREPGAGELVASADSADPGAHADELDFELVELGAGVVGRAARFARTEGHGRPTLDGTCGDPGPDRTDEAIAVPMVVGAEVIGVIQVIGTGVAQLPVDTLDVLEVLAVQAASAIGAARVHQHTEVMAMTDALTGLPNRRRLEEDLATEVAVAGRHERPLGFAMVDVDHFKAYNDEFGHQAGDVALQALARLLATNARAGDTVYRYGGEELAIIMRETDTEGAQRYAARLCQLVEHHFAGPAQLRSVTISAGVASIPSDAATPELLVASADAALYEAKRRGRNRVVPAGEIISGRLDTAS